MRNGTNIGTEVKTPLGPTPSSLQGGGLRRLEPSSRSHAEAGVGRRAVCGSTQGKGVVDIYRSRMQGAACSPGPLMPTEPGVSSGTQSTLPALPSAASPSPPVLHILRVPAYGVFSWVQSSPGTEVRWRTTSHLTGKSAPHPARNRLKATQNKLPGSATEVIQIPTALEVLGAAWIR